MRINKRSRPFRAQCFQLGQSFRAFPIGAHVSSPYVLPQCPGYDTSAYPTTLVCAAPLTRNAAGTACTGAPGGVAPGSLIERPLVASLAAGLVDMERMINCGVNAVDTGVDPIESHPH
jgi:hypothetical protein